MTNNPNILTSHSQVAALDLIGNNFIALMLLRQPITEDFATNFLLTLRSVRDSIAKQNNIKGENLFNSAEFLASLAMLELQAEGIISTERKV